MAQREDYMIKELRIRNFKSLSDVVLDGCRRINVLIGRPNVGKSNILEALALFDTPYLALSNNKSLKSLVRVENIPDLFHNGITAGRNISVSAGTNSLKLYAAANNGLAIDTAIGETRSKYNFSQSLTLTSKKEPNSFPDILAYFFPRQFDPERAGLSYLLPPSGSNLMEVVASLPDLKGPLSELFHGYGLKMVFDTASNQIKAMRENGADIFLVPFKSLADSLQRLIFYKAAIRSNRNKVICFEEPESHTFPPYIASIVNDILASEENQFFITTHSPYIINSLLEDAGDELAVYVADMKDNATIVRRLSDSEMQNAYDCGMDMYFRAAMPASSRYSIHLRKTRKWTL